MESGKGLSWFLAGPWAPCMQHWPHVSVFVLMGLREDVTQVATHIICLSALCVVRTGGAALGDLILTTRIQWITPFYRWQNQVFQKPSDLPGSHNNRTEIWMCALWWQSQITLQTCCTSLVPELVIILSFAQYCQIWKLVFCLPATFGARQLQHPWFWWS